MFFSNKVAVAEEIATPDQISGRFVANPAPPGFNINGSSVATNFLDAYNKKQFFIKTAHSSVLFETPSSDVGHAGSIWWCGDLSFSNFFDNSVPMGFVGRCVYMFYDGKTQLVDQGVPGLIDDGIFDASMGITCVYVDQTNTFDCVSHRNTDNVVLRFVDDGRPTSQFILWETHDAGKDKTPIARSAFAKIIWVKQEEVSQVLKVNTTELTPEYFHEVYTETWAAEYKLEETGKQESNTAAEPATDDHSDVGSDSAPSGSGRQLSSMAMRLASAVLRVFGA